MVVGNVKSYTVDAEACSVLLFVEDVTWRATGLSWYVPTITQEDAIMHRAGRRDIEGTIVFPFYPNLAECLKNVREASSLIVGIATGAPDSQHISITGVTPRTINENEGEIRVGFTANDMVPWKMHKRRKHRCRNE